MYFVLLPTQLYETTYLSKDYTYILWEHPHYFTKYKFNKKKLLLHKSSMKYYYEYLQKKKYNVQYIEYTKPFTYRTYTLFDPIDSIKLPGKPEFVESPNFLLTKEEYGVYRKKTKSFVFNAFYNFGKKCIQVLEDVKSQDKYNRKTLPKNIEIPNIPSNTADRQYIQDSIPFVEKHFPKNYGNTKNFVFPVTHKTAKKWLQDFIRKRFEKFGDYQDAIIQKETFLFHSLLSTSLNIGLLQPMDVIQEVMKYRKTIPINSLEGFVRQLFWREYQRYCYIYVDFTTSYFRNTKKLSKDWYHGTTGILPVDTSIQNAFDNGYLHHIERLMVIGNYMNLSGINEKEGFRWFMEFSCDSYEWVMYQNVYDMVFFVTGGKTMRKPYVSSSNYIVKMSNYKKDTWCDTWNTLYYQFLKKHKQKLWKFRYHFRGLQDV